MYLGNQVAIFRNLPVGRYIVTLSYSGFVITKGAVLCGDGGEAWKADCVGSLKDALKRGKPQGQYTDVMGSQYGYYGWTQASENVQQYSPYGYGTDNNQNAGGWTNSEPQQSDMVPADPVVGHTEPCQTVIIFNMPEDVFKYNSAEKRN